MVSIVCAAVIAAVTVLLLLLAFTAQKKGFNLSKIRRPMAIALLVISFARYIYREAPIYYVRGLESIYSPFNTPEPRPIVTALAIILVWFSYAAMLTVVFSEFFNYKTLRRVVSFFSLPVFTVSTVFFKTYAIASLGVNGYSFSTARIWFMVVEAILVFTLSLSHILVDRDDILPKQKREVGTLLYATFAAVLPTMPCYVLQAFFTGVDETIKLYDFTEAHRIMLYFAFIIPVVLFHLMKNKSQDVKRFFMLYLSVALLWIYIGRWNLQDLSSPLSWPLHLCNTAMFIIPICILFKMDRLFNFCLFINVMGALLAMILPGELDGLNAIGTERVSFWVNHYAAFFMPVLLVALKVFKRPKFKQWVYAVIALTVYFLAMLFVNAWFTNYGDCDYFFLNSDFIVSSLGAWAERTRDIVVSFEFKGLTFTFYPLYQALFYIVYIAFTVGIWFIYALLFASWDAAEDRRQRERDYKRMKKELHEFLGGRTIHEPISGDSSPRLILNHFSKRYGSNKHYSVRDVSFEVRGGEIFGFLGPNGAGKSTIIKSMVGIQTITSGDIEICGFNINRQPVQAKLNTGFVPDHYALYENLTGREYINYIADLYQVDAESRNKRIEKYVERFQLTGSFDNQMKTYSHGMKQKITIMSALVHNPKVWILDEPLTGLDPTSIHEVKECMKEHAEAGNIVFFSSHIIDLVEKLCDRIAIIKKGKLRACVKVSELTEQGIELEQYYLNIINSTDDEHAPYEEPEKDAEKLAGEAASV